MLLMCLASVSIAFAQTDGNNKKSRLGRNQPDLICPDIDQPVCGRDGVTYGNACEARKAGKRFGPGSCDRSRGILCPAIFKPVCGVDSTGVKRTFPNACRANAAGVQRFEEGPCEKTNPITKPVQPIEDICPAFVKPVCGSDGRTYENPCKAKQAEVDYREGVCGSSARDFARDRGREGRPKVGLPGRARPMDGNITRGDRADKVHKRLEKFDIAQSKEHVQKSKAELKERRASARACKQQRTAECKEARKNLRGGLIKVYHDVAHKRTLRLDQAERRINAADLSPEERDVLLERIKAQRDELEKLREKAAEFDEDTTKQELKAYVSELKTAQKESKRSVNIGQTHGVTTKLGNAQKALGGQLERVQKVVSERNLDFQSSIDAVQADVDKIDEFSTKLLDLISGGDIEDAKAVMVEARDHVRDTHKALKDLVVKVRETVKAAE